MQPSRGRFEAMRSDSWFYEVFRQWPDLILHFVAGLTPAQRLLMGYRYEAPVLKASEHRLDGVLLPPHQHPELPVVILEVQMFADPLFFHRLYAETGRYLQQHPGVHRWQIVVLTPQAGLRLGPVEPFAEFLEHRVRIVGLEELSRREGLEPLEELLTLVVRQEPELGPTSRRLVARKPELSAMIATILWKRLPSLSLEEIMAIAGIQLADLSETRAYQDILAKGLKQGLEQGRQEGFREEAAGLVLRQLRRLFGDVPGDHEQSIRVLATAELEDLAEALMDFTTPADLTSWLASRGGS
jgi:predicted transposase YdaD